MKQCAFIRFANFNRVCTTSENITGLVYKLSRQSKCGGYFDTIAAVYRCRLIVIPAEPLWKNSELQIYYGIYELVLILMSGQTKSAFIFLEYQSACSVCRNAVHSSIINGVILKLVCFGAMFVREMHGLQNTGAEQDFPRRKAIIARISPHHVVFILFKKRR